jgi:multiple sugar transport system permease protein
VTDSASALAARPRTGASPAWWLGRAGLHLVLTALALFMVFPFLWTIGNSLKLPGEIFTWPPTLLPAAPRPANYLDLFRTVPFFSWLRNSLVVTLTATLGAVLSSTMAGYAFARLRYPGRDVFFTICLSTMMLPGIVTLIPSFILYRHLGWIDTLLPLIVPSWLGTAFYIFLSRQHFRTIPREYEEAARMDGATSWRIWWTLMLPMSRTLVGALVIFSFIAHWNEFIHPLIYLNSVENQTLALGLRGLQNLYNTRWDYIMAGAVLMTTPMVVVFFLAQRFFIEGMSAFSGLAGR